MDVKALNPPTSTGMSSICVLVVDDHPSAAVTLARAISRCGPEFEVLYAEGGEQAIEVMRNRTVDLLITDLVMPGVTGLELIERMQTIPGGRPAYIILMTAYNVPGLKEISRRLMVNEIVNKPIQPEIICRMIAKAVRDCGFGPPSWESGETRQAPPGGEQFDDPMAPT